MRSRRTKSLSPRAITAACQAALLLSGFVLARLPAQSQEAPAVTCPDDFQNYGSPRIPSGWIGTAVRASKQAEETNDRTSAAIETAIQYDTNNPYVVTYDAVGRDSVTRQEYDEAGNLIRVATTGTDVDSEEVFAYDARGRLVVQRTKQNAASYVEELYRYDLLGRMIEHETRETGNPDPLQKTTLHYDLPNRTTRTVLPAGGEIISILDGLGRVQDRVTDPKNPAFMGLPSVMTERTRYDIAGNVVYQSDDRAASATQYDAVHRVVATLDSTGVRTAMTYDGFGRVKTAENLSTGFKVENDLTPGGKLNATTTSVSEQTFKRDGAGRTSAVISKPGAGGVDSLTNLTFDDAGRLHNQSFGEANAAGAMTRAYSSMKQNFGTTELPLSVETSEDNNASTYIHSPTFDAVGRATEVTTAGASDMTVRQSFDDIGNVETIKTPAMAGETGFAYDGRGLMTEETLPAVAGGGPAVNKFEYDANGVLKQYTDATDEPTRTENDGLGRPFRRTYADGSSEEIHYDQWRVAKIKDRQERWQEFQYDAHGRLEVVLRSGVELDRLTYDSEGRLIVWRTPESRLEFSSFDVASRPQLTKQTRFHDGAPVDEYTQSHTYDGFGRRTSWTMPVGAAALPAGWTTSVIPRYDAAGNLSQLDRMLSGGSDATLLTSDYRAAGRPNHRTIMANAGSASPVEIKREYGYEPDAGRMTAFRVFAGSQLMAGSEITFEGTLRKSARLLGLSNGERSNSWEYDDRGRLRASAAASKNAIAALAAIGPEVVLPKLSQADFLEAVERPAGTAPPKTFAESAAGHKIEHAGDPANPFRYAKDDGSDGGSLRTRDAHFEYEWDEKERLRKATQRLTGGEGILLRAVYSYNGLGRMIGRRMEIAPVASGTPPDDDDFVLATPAQLGPDAGLPPDTTFVWDPVSDQMVAAFNAATGQPIRQHIHGGLGLDDPIEVAVAESNGNVARYYPVYDEAGDGALQAILDHHGRIVTRTLLTDPYGDGEATIAGPAVESVTVKSTPNDTIEIDVTFTEPIDESTLAEGVRLAAIGGTGEAAGGGSGTSTGENQINAGASLNAATPIADVNPIFAGSSIDPGIDGINANTLVATGAATADASLPINITSGSSATTNANTVVAISTAIPTLAGNGYIVRWTLSATEWSALTDAPDARSLSIAITDTLRSQTFTAATAILPGDTTQTGVTATPDTPFELRESFTHLLPRLAEGTSPIPLYELATIAPPSASGTGNTGLLSLSVGAGAITANTFTADSASLLLLTASFQAQSFTDPFTLKNYVRARWYDPGTGTFLTPDPLGYVDSSNLYAFCGGDPVNCADPSGEAEEDRQSDIGDSIKLVTESMLNTFNSSFDIFKKNNIDKIARGVKEFFGAVKGTYIDGDPKSVKKFSQQLTSASLAWGNTAAEPGRHIGTTAVVMSQPLQFADDMSRELPENEIRREIASAVGPTAAIATIFSGIGAAEVPSSLQVVPTTRLAAGTVDDLVIVNYQRYYDEAASNVIQRFNAGKITIPAGLSWKTVLGREIDSIARARLRNFLVREGVAEGPGQGVLVNRWLRDPSGTGLYRIPDVRLEHSRTILDGTIGRKTMHDPQVVDFIEFSGGYRVVIVRPRVAPGAWNR